MKDKIYGKGSINTDNIKDFESYAPSWITLDQVKAIPQTWFWEGVIPSETLTLFAGYGAIGKSILLLYIAAKTTTGEIFKAGGMKHRLKKGSVILLSAEDNAEKQIKPKLVAMGADCSKIHLIKSKIGNVSNKHKFLELEKDLYILEQKIDEIGDVSLIIIDPITYFLGSVRDINTEVANFLLHIMQLSENKKITTLLNKHLRKQATGERGIANAVNEIAGSGAWANTPRKCLIVSNHPDEKGTKVITSPKDNLGDSRDKCLGYKIVATTIIENHLVIPTTELIWLDDLISITSDEAMSKETYEKGKLEQAVDFISSYLEKNGQSVVAHICEEAIKKGIKKKTFRNATTVFEQSQKGNLIITKGIRGAKIYSFSD